MTERRKIAFIVNFLTHYRLSFYEKLYSHNEYEWCFFYGIKDRQDGRPEYQGLLNFPGQPIGYREWKIGPFYVRWQKNVLGLVRKWRPDVVITLGIPSTITNWMLMNWAKNNKISTITWHCGWESQQENTISLFIKQMLTRRYLLLSDQTLVYSTRGFEYLKSLGYEQQKLTVCYNGLEIDQLLRREVEYRNKAKLLREQYQVNGKKVFLYVGGMMFEKQVLLLLEAFSSMPEDNNICLWLIGDGPNLVDFKEFTARKKIKNVNYLGRIVEDVDAYFAAADFFVLPGIGGLALNQAMFWGLPCVVSQADGTEDDLIYDGITGYRFTSLNVASLRGAMEKCLALTETERNKIGFAGRKLILERSNANQMVNTFIRTIDSVARA